ncbi:uncharacterized protein LOC116848465 [Odontomachus brunneus]|uniref:uncharacterized protein LOC116848465 n=1 Tax=Odontomachus brunneus TaxID=486640 RepID=UPI0013F1C9A7|nr:uncharacterized protein LOC116848465 [Odontomachus brunneus]
MICVETDHFSINRILLLVVGLWPYQRSKLVRLQTIIIFAILMSFLIFQTTVFLTAEFTSDLFINVLTTALLFCTFSVNFLSFWFNIRTIKCLLEKLQKICNELKDENEIAIIKRYGYQAKRITASIILICVFIEVGLLGHLIWPRFLGIFLFLNESWPRRKTFILTEYFVDQEKYSNLIWLHMNTAICIGAFAAFATGTLLLVFLKYACGMFSIASYRIEQAITNKKRENDDLKDQNVIFKKIIYAVDIHRNAMQYSDFLISSFEGTFFLLITFGVVCLSLNLFRTFQLALSGSDKFELLSRFVCTVFILLYMFLANAIGQEITDHNDQVYFTAYKVIWYTTPLHVQKLILFLIQRGNKTFGLNVGGLFVASLECFATLISASLSYFTVMYSTQQ